jgi:hypothetical protein
MCGSDSAIGLAESERALWPHLRERLREPGSLMGLMRGVLGGAVEVATVVATTPDGVVRPVALVATPAITGEIELSEAGGDDVRPARIGDDDIDVLVATRPGQDGAEPVAILVTPWIAENLGPLCAESVVATLTGRGVGIHKTTIPRRAAWSPACSRVTCATQQFGCSRQRRFAALLTRTDRAKERKCALRSCPPQKESPRIQRT